MIDYLPKAAKPVLGPVWRKGLSVGATFIDAGNKLWTVEKTDECARDIHWRCIDDGRVARTEVTPDHPDYPPDLTREQLKERARLAKEARKSMYGFGYGYIP